MAKKKKKGLLPSGNIQVRVTDYKDENGKWHYKSFTAPTRAEAEDLAREWKKNKAKNKNGSVTVLEACTRYCDAGDAVKSPATTRGYKQIVHTYIEDDPIGKIDIFELTSEDVQRWISKLSLTRAPKTIRNIWTVMNETYKTFVPDKVLRVHLPALIPVETYTPNDEEVWRVIETVKGRGDVDLLFAIYMGAFGPLRRSEICALTDKDIEGVYVTVNKDTVLNEYNEWVVKIPKTYASFRVLKMPKVVMDEVRAMMKGRTGTLVQCNPNNITSRFENAVKRCGVTPFRFHDLRHYAVSIQHYMKIPMMATQSRGGWASDATIKKVYLNSIKSENVKYDDQMNEHFDQLISGVSYKDENRSTSVSYGAEFPQIIGE